MGHTQQYNIPYLVNGYHYIYDYQEDQDKITIFVESKPHSCQCTVCHQKSDLFHSTYDRVLQDIPIHGKKTYLHVKAHKYYCINEQCKCNVFMEELPFALPSQVRTLPLNTLIISVSMFLNYDAASKVLSLLGISVSNDTIKRIHDHVLFKADTDEGMVVIYNIKDHKPLTLLSGRNAITLNKYIETHKKIRITDKDKAIAYAKAIEDVLPVTKEVAGHLLFQSLIDRLRIIFVDDIID